MRRWKIASAVAASGTLVGGCTALSIPTNPFGGQATSRGQQPLPGQLEAVHAAAVAKGEAVFWVSSNGCTNKDDLTPVVRRVGDQAVLTLRRVNADTCREVQPEGVELRWSFQELGLSPNTRLTIENPYQPPPGET
jgi:hypothetical protein